MVDGVNQVHALQLFASTAVNEQAIYLSSVVQHATNKCERHDQAATTKNC